MCFFNFFHVIGNFADLSVKNAGFAFFLGATVALPGEVFSSLERLHTFFMLGEYNVKKTDIDYR